MTDVSRRGFLTLVPALVPTVAAAGGGQAPPQSTPTPESFPRQDPAIALEVVGAAHGNVARVKELVGARPALARAVWDWGYGDWETALGAASHVGHKEIAAVLLAAGAHPTIFSAAMLGQIDVVKSFVAASPGIQKTRGPHGITLLDHAKNGKSVEVVTYLEGLGGADPKYPAEPMADGDPDALLGAYSFGSGTTDRFIVARNARGGLVVKREGAFDRLLSHHGGRVFNPAGAEAVEIRFEPATGPVSALVVADGPVRVRASRG